MIKQHKRGVILSSAILLLPILFGLLIWNKLPEQIPLHWNTAEDIDRYGGKLEAVLFLPLFILAVHWFCIFATSFDPKNKNTNHKVSGLVLWICPILSVLAAALIYTAAFGVAVKVNQLLPVFLGLLFIVIGNYLPKCKQNHTIGIKLALTLNSEDNWNNTHRTAGFIW